MTKGKRKIRKVLIANRGEIAVRVIRTCRELGVKTVAVFSDVDRGMPHVQMADEAFPIGPAPSRQSYLNGEKILSVARAAGVDAIHPGYGFLSENEAFARGVGQSGMVFVGPDADAIRLMGDKTAARKLMQQVGVPVVPGMSEVSANLDEVDSFCRTAGYPILIKAAAGGGGKGMRVVAGPEELQSSYRAARSEAMSAFGDDRVYVEKYLSKPRHVEFQILADAQGSTVHLGERECSIQRRHQKVVEESPSVVLSADLRERMGAAAVKAAEACHYVNAGTIEFLVDGDLNFYFLEMNTRLQVEHPVTEMRTGIDLVACQLKIAEGESLGFGQGDITFRGHAIECRIYAEDPSNNYLPSTGMIRHLRPSHGFGIRDDRGVEKGSEISLYYDPLISKLVAWGRTREEALLRMDRALREYEILGVSTNIPLNLRVIRHPQFRSGDFDTHFLANNPDVGLPFQLDKSDEPFMAAFAAMLYLREGDRQSSGRVASRNHVEETSHDWKRNGWKSSRVRHLRG